MKVFIRILEILAALSIVVTVLGACEEKAATTASGESGKILRYQQPASIVYPVELAADLGYLGDVQLESVGNYKGGPESIQLTATGEIDFGWAFNGALVKSASKNVNLVSVIGAYGSDDVNFTGAYVLEESEIDEPKDLIGKKVGVNILGAHSEFTLVEYLRQGGLNEAEIKQVQLVTIPTTNAEQSLRAGHLDAILLLGAPQDLALERGGLKRLFTDTEVFGFNFTGGNYFFTEAFVEENPETVQQFVEGIAKAIEWARTTPREEVITRFADIIEKRPGNESTDYVQYWKSFGIANEGGVIADEEFDVWIDWLVKSGELQEGDIQVKDLYTNEFNPYAK
ncbi:ABC transporter substrate-binding protein [Lysinibacillus sp. KU-BSD001]|uniref:ABC transporter substrate-binding protein n=1 Tax=Lysinibacillus sp. KU-BSD001 TaxID=3141328 RepID=UPI0036E9FE0A